MNFDYKFKIALLGDSRVGKSSLLSREVYGDYLELYQPTVAVGYSSKVLNYDNKKIKLDIWDLSGDERYRTVLKTYLKHIHAVIIVYDVTNPESFNNVKQWVDFVESAHNGKVVYILLANKIDKKKERLVNVDLGIRYALKNGMLYLDVSAKNGKTMNFLTMVNEILIEKFRNEKSNPEKSNKEYVRWCSCDII
mgnify:FL=1